MPRRNVLVVLVVLLVVGWVRSVAQPEKRFYKENREFHHILSLVLNRYVKEVPPQKLFEGAYRGMLRQLDPYCQYFTPAEAKSFEEDTAGKFGGLGIEIGMRDGILTVITPLVDTPAWKAGVLPGDRILAIDGKSTENLGLLEAVKLLRGKPGTKVTITVRHPGARANDDITITRGEIKPTSVEYRIVSDEPKIAYIRVYSFTQEMIKQFDEAARKLEAEPLEGLVLDLRGNPGGLLDAAVKLSDRFLEKGVIVSVRGRGDEMAWRATRENVRFAGVPLVILVDAGTASASEITSAALRDNGRALIVGTNTFGKGAVQTVTRLESGGAVKLTTAMYHTPAGREISHESPIEPDVVIEMSVDRIIALRQQRVEDKLRGKDLNGPEKKPGPKGEEAGKRKRVRDIQLDGAVAILKAQIRAAKAVRTAAAR